MSILYVTEPGAVLRRQGQGLVVTVDRRDPAADPDTTATSRAALARVASHGLDAVILVGRSGVTTDAVHLCLDQGIALGWLGRDGRFLGRLVPAGGAGAALRLGQYALAADPARRLALARPVIRGKLDNAAAVLRQLQGNRPGRPDFAEAIAALKAAAATVATAAGADALRGIEGAAARAYFHGLAAGFDGGAIGFAHRQRRPPPDPANALLSFGYVLLGRLLAGATEALGLDPALGFLHAPHPGRASLSLDLLEELRHPVVDRLVLRLCNLRILTPEAFEPDPDTAGGTRLTADGLKRFLAAWEDWLDRPLPERDRDDRIAPRALVRRQSERIAAAIRDGTAYQPFRFRA